MTYKSLSITNSNEKSENASQPKFEMIDKFIQDQSSDEDEGKFIVKNEKVLLI